MTDTSVMNGGVTTKVEELHIPVITEYEYTSDEEGSKPLYPIDVMSPGRVSRTRKQRPCRRRGGAGHSELLQSAVLASLSYEPGHSFVEDGIATPCMSEQSLEKSDGSSGRSCPRKRSRQAGADECDEDFVEKASQLLEDLNFGRTSRHVLRRRSCDTIEGIISPFPSDGKQIS